MLSELTWGVQKRVVDGQEKMNGNGLDAMYVTVTELPSDRRSVRG